MADGQPELAVFVCIHCGCEIDHAHKLWMVEHGEWRPGPHAQFPNVPAPKPWHGHASFHIWAAYSLLPNTTWGHIAETFVKANAAGAEQLKTFINTWLGETWQAKGEAPDWERLYERRERYAPGTCPRGVLFLTAGVDVQPNRLVYEVVGWGRDKESWSIAAEVFPGDTSDLSPAGPWTHIDALLDRTFRHEFGPELRIRMLSIDSGDQTQVVYNYVRNEARARDGGEGRRHHRRHDRAAVEG
jgi:phage terminase large subunit GpA-like protein